ncbi:hypothetical protein QZH41_018540, partial [Actinostola sp. cb2023]
GCGGVLYYTVHKGVVGYYAIPYIGVWWGTMLCYTMQGVVGYMLYPTSSLSQPIPAPSVAPTALTQTEVNPGPSTEDDISSGSHSVNEPTISPSATPSSTSTSTEPSSSHPPFDITPGPSGVKDAGTPQLTKTATDYSLRLPFGWKENISPGDQTWLGRALFIAKHKLQTTLQNWWYPPQVSNNSTNPTAKQYFLRRLFLWMPRKMWGVDFSCPNCAEKRWLRSKGLYNRVRLVLDNQEFYYLAAEYMDCNACKGTFIAWDNRMLNQLSDGVRARFPVILTRKYACDKSIVTLLRARTFGNSPAALQNNIQELHSQQWLQKTLSYLTDCERQRKALSALGHTQAVNFEVVPSIQNFPSAKWFLAAYVRDVYSRLPDLLAQATSIYGKILKVDSTKKICKKLQGHSVGSASWVTNVGNEKGQIVQSVLTASEGTPALQKLADGLVQRYETAHQAPPLLLYTDRDCCKLQGVTKYNQLFERWPELIIRLDIFHYMRRLALGVTSESHPLYGMFMHRISSAIFEWDEEDYQLLCEAKKGQLIQAGVPRPTESAVRKAISKDELAKHCKRKTRGLKETKESIEGLLLSLSTATDTLGVPLFKEEIKDIWDEQKRHVACIQDPSDIPLYTVTGHLSKGGQRLPIYRCARGSTSLESFHLHLARFIPGTSANSVNFQAFLLDGITRWNTARALESLETEATPIRSFDTRLQVKINSLSEKVYGEPLFPHCRPPSKYTGELIGVEYLFHQTGDTFSYEEETLDREIDDGFVDINEEEMMGDIDVLGDVDDGLDMSEGSSESEDEESEEMSASGQEEDEAYDARGIPGWDKVDALAKALVELDGLSVTNAQARVIKELYENLLDYDKKPISFKTRPVKPTRGRFARSKRSGHVTLEAMKRCFITAGAPASSPSLSRIVEAICIRLCETYPLSRTQHGHRGRKVYTSRWRLVLSAYNSIRARVFNSQSLEDTNFQLYHINESTLMNWYKDRVRRDEVKVLMQGLQSPETSLLSREKLPPALRRPSSPPASLADPHVFAEVEDTTGQAQIRGSQRRNVPAGTLVAQVDDQPVQAPVQTATVVTSRTTDWRRRKAMMEGNAPGSKVPRKTYECRVCHLPMASEGHTQYKGKRYCPNAPGQISKTEWLAQRKAEDKAKAAAKASSNS